MTEERDQNDDTDKEQGDAAEPAPSEKGEGEAKPEGDTDKGE